MAHRKMLEQTLVNLVYDMDWIGLGPEIDDELSKISDDDLIAILNKVIENMN